MIWNCRERLDLSSCDCPFQLEAAETEVENWLGRDSNVGSGSVAAGIADSASALPGTGNSTSVVARIADPTSVVAGIGDPGPEVNTGRAETLPESPIPAPAGARNCSCHSSRPLSRVR